MAHINNGYGNIILPAMEMQSTKMAQATSNDDSSHHNAMINVGSIAVKVSRRFDSSRYTKKETKKND